MPAEIQSVLFCAERSVVFCAYEPLSRAIAQLLPFAWPEIFMYIIMQFITKWVFLSLES